MSVISVITLAVDAQITPIQLAKLVHQIHIWSTTTLNALIDFQEIVHTVKLIGFVFKIIAQINYIFNYQ